MNKDDKTSSNPGSRRDFLRKSAALGLGAAMFPLQPMQADVFIEKANLPKPVVPKSLTQKITILYTSDIHAQLHTHDEFFWEEGKSVYRKRGGLAVLKTMINSFRSKAPEQTILIDGGDYYHGHAVASLTEGEAMIPIFNSIDFDLLPFNS